MKHRILYIIISVAAITLFIESCAMTPSYKRSGLLPVDGLFRSLIVTDTTNNYATVPVYDFYDDSLLQPLITEALDSNYNVKLAINRLAQVSQYLRQSKAALLPTLDIGLKGSVSDVSKYGNSARPKNPYTELNLAAATSWEIDVWGKLSSAKRSQQAQYFQQEATVRAIQTQIVSDVASSYYQLITLDHQRDVTERSIESYTNYLQTVEALKNSAQVTEVAVLQAKSQLAAAKVYLPQIEKAIAIEENYLCQLLGKVPGPVSRSSQFDLTLFHTGLLSVGVPAQLLSNRPDVQAAEYVLCSAHEQFNAARAAMYPQLTLTGSLGPDAKGLSNWFNMPGSLLWNAVAGLMQPIFNGRTLKTQKEIARLQEDAAFILFKQTLMDAGNEVSNGLASIRFTTQQAEYQKEQVEALKKAYEYSQELLVNGYATYLDVLSAQNSVLSSELSLYTTYNEIIQQKIILYRALGGGWK
jgi:NodT family efflux transporter outer membrane factor (OMF) lipoprotein